MRQSYAAAFLNTRRTVACLCLFALLGSASRSAEQYDVIGLWLTGDGDGWIRIERSGDGLTGTIAGSPTRKPSDPVRYDDLNPDPALRNRPLDGLAILQGFRYDGEGRWSHGTVYDPNSGNTYRATLTLLDSGTLRIRGFIGVTLFGRSDTWTRVPD